MLSFSKAGQGSGDLFSQLVDSLIPKINDLSYSDMIRFFELFPKISYIYDHTMTKEIHAKMLLKFKEVILKQKSLPTEDICKIFDILVQTTAFGSKDEVNVVNEVVKRLRSNLHGIPKELFAKTLANLIEF